jgi:hypothetical protein
MNDALLEARIQKLEDIEAIKDLMAHYSRYVDKGYGGKAVEVDNLSKIFTEDIEREVAGTNLGGSGLKDLMKEVAEATAAAEFTMHSYSNPIIAVDGDDAKGNWLSRSTAKNSPIGEPSTAGQSRPAARISRLRSNPRTNAGVKQRGWWS